MNSKAQEFVVRQSIANEWRMHVFLSCLYEALDQYVCDLLDCEQTTPHDAFLRFGDGSIVRVSKGPSLPSLSVVILDVFTVLWRAEKNEKLTNYFQDDIKRWDAYDYRHFKNKYGKETADQMMQ